MISPARMRATRGWLAALGAVAALVPAAPALAAGKASPDVVKLATSTPTATAQVIVQFNPGVTRATAEGLVRQTGGEPGAALPIINALSATLTAAEAKTLSGLAGVRAVSMNAKTKPQAISTSALSTAYDLSVAADRVWNSSAALTGKGVGVAVIDSGIAGDLPDFRTSSTNTASRVVASAVTNPNATNAGDPYGHGTHVAGILAGNGLNRPSSDANDGKYIGIAPEANLISIKAGDENGDATIIDVINGLQFAIDHKSDYNIRVVNLSLESASTESYTTDPLDAAVEQAWFSGIVVVAAAGNRGTAADAVQHAPGNDPYVISVGAADDAATRGTLDDTVASWSSTGRTQDGFAKPDVVAPGAHIISTLSPGSAFAGMCPTCVVGGAYIKAGGTSMAAPVVAGLAALVLQAHPAWTPDQVKGAIVSTARSIAGGTAREVVADRASVAYGSALVSNQNLTPSTVLIDPVTGLVDLTRSSWSRSSWSAAPSGLTASWSRSSWSCTCSRLGDGTVDPTRSSWSRSSWSTSWSL